MISDSKPTAVVRQSAMLLAVTMLISLAFAARAQDFSCRIGTQPTCLSYGDKVCSSSGMCVDQNAACIDSFQCNHEGFTCKSNVTECVEAHDALLRTHNDLVDDFNDNLEIAKGMAARLNDIESCLIYASTLEAARLCSQ